MDFVTMSDGARLATWTAPGPAGSPAVILVHGGPGLWDYLTPLAELLAARAPVHRYDQRGWGSSTGPDGGYADDLASAGAVPSDITMERFVKDIEELRRAFGHERVVLIGHSFGATLALAYAGTHTERVTGLAYVDGVGVGDWRTPYRAERARRLAPWAERFAELDGQSRTPEEEVEWRRLAWATAARCPISFIHGTADPRPVGPVVSLAAHARAPRKRVVPGAGHLPCIEQPERMREILAELVLSASHRE